MVKSVGFFIGKWLFKRRKKAISENTPYTFASLTIVKKVPCITALVENLAFCLYGLCKVNHYKVQ